MEKFILIIIVFFLIVGFVLSIIFLEPNFIIYVGTIAVLFLVCKILFFFLLKTNYFMKKVQRILLAINFMLMNEKRIKFYFVIGYFFILNFNSIEYYFFFEVFDFFDIDFSRVAFCMENNDSKVNTSLLKCERIECDSVVGTLPPEFFKGEPGDGTISSFTDPSTNQNYFRICGDKVLAESVGNCSRWFKGQISSGIQDNCICFRRINQFMEAVAKLESEKK